MSYDFTLLALDPNADVFKTLEMRERSHGIFNDEGRQRAREIANALRVKNPALDWQPYSSGRLECVEINSDIPHYGIHISVFPDEASLTVPYWYEADEARPIFRQIWGYLEILQQLTTFAIFDPQLGRVIDLNVDFEPVLASYSGTMGYIHTILGRDSMA